MSTNFTYARCVIFGFVVLIAGCADSPSQKTPAIPTNSGRPAQDGPIITSTDKQELMKGAGIVDADAPKEFTSTDSGLKYRILRKTSGKKPAPSNYVKVNYRGWLDDGTEFDSSYKRGEPTGFPLRGVIRGWTEGLQFVSEGGMIELWIPSELAYGAAGRPGIPPNSTLHFIVELLEVK